MLKGWFYVLLTALLLYALVNRGVRKLKISREALRLSEEHYRALVESAGSIILRVDLLGRITFLNDFALEFFGVSRAEVTGRPVVGTIVPEKDSRGRDLAGSMRQLLESPERRPSQQEEVVRADGERVWIAWTNTVVRGPGGGESEILRIGNDVTEQKKTADALLDKERRLNQVLENANDGYFDWDLITDEVYFSPRYYRMLGYEPEEFPASYRNFLKLVHPDSIEDVHDSVSRMRRNAEDAVSVEFRARSRDGQWKWILSRGHIARRDADGNTTRFVGVHIDITEHKRAEEVLQGQRLLVASSRDAIFLLRREDGLILEANDAAATAYGRTREELLEMTVHDLRAAETRPLTVSQMAEADTKGILFETLHRRRDGSVFPVEVSSRGDAIGGERILVSIVRDITERKEAEEALRERDLQFRTMFNVSPDAVSIATYDETRILEVNDTFLRLTGFTREEVVGRTASELGLWVHEEERLAVRLLLADHGRVKDFEARLRTRSGIRTVRMTIERIELEGSPRIIGFTRDITERKGAEEALRASEERLRLAQEAASAGTWEWDLDTNENLWSEELWRLYGLEPGSRRASYEVWRETIHPDDLEKTERAVLEAAREGKRLYAEWRVRLADGTERWLLSQGRPCHVPDGRVARYIGIVFDITERKRTEMALRQWADAFEYCAHGIVIGDPSTNRTFACNPAFARLMGRAVEEVAGMSILDMYAPESHDRVRRKIVEADSVGHVRHEIAMRRSDGTLLPVQVDLVSVRDDTGSLLYRVATVQDISERRRAEEGLRDSLEEKDALLREVHHRVKNNLQIVASLLNLQANRSDNPLVVDVLGETRNRVHSMALLHEVLYRSGNLARINFNAYVEELCRHLRRVFGAISEVVALENRVARIGLPLEQSVPCGLIINELVSNALKHAFPDGRTGAIAIELEPVEGEGLILKVSDNGVGFPPGQGIGSSATLGLRLVSNLASQLAGQLEMEKPPEGSGTTFRLVIPFTEGTRYRGES